MIDNMKKDKLIGARCIATMFAMAMTLASLGGCGSFFPSQAAQRSADKILDGILPAKGSNDAPPKEKTAETTTAEAKKP